LVPLLTEAGHEALAIELPGSDERAGLPEYTSIVLERIGQRDDVIVVAQSLGGFTAPLVCEQARVRMLVLLNAMIPGPGERAGEWWDATGASQAREAAAQRGGYNPAFDLQTYFLHDVPEDVIQAGAQHRHEEAAIVFSQPCSFAAWPAIPIYVLVGRDDRFFPRAFQERVARERLGRDIDELAGGHLVALSQPRALAERLIAYEHAETRRA
jgi:pimeloyl-ACP methyl ester carboxylesterase